MHFHEQARNTNGHGRARENGHHRTIPAAGGSLPARLLHGVCGIENHGIARLCHNRQGAHVADEGVVAETGAALREQDILIARTRDFCGDIFHVPGREELAFFNVNHRAGLPRREQQIRLTTQKRWNLQDINHFRDRGALFFLMNIGEYRQAKFFFEVLEHRQGLIETEAPLPAHAGAIGFVEGGFVDKGNVQPLRNLLDPSAHVKGVIPALHLAWPGDEDKWIGLREGNILNGNGFHGLCFIPASADCKRYSRKGLQSMMVW